MEEQMGEVVNKVDEVLKKLDQVDGPRKSSAIGRGVRNIASAKGICKIKSLRIINWFSSFLGDEREKREQMEDLIKGELDKIED